MSITLKEFLFGKKTMSDREILKNAVFNKRFEVMRQKADTLFDVKIFAPAVKDIKEKIENYVKDEKYDKTKYQELQVDLKAAEENLKQAYENLSQQSRALEMLNERYENIENFVDEVVNKNNHFSA